MPDFVQSLHDALQEIPRMEASPREGVTFEIDAAYVRQRYLALDEPTREHFAALWCEFQALAERQNGMNDAAQNLRCQLTVERLGTAGGIEPASREGGPDDDGRAGDAPGREAQDVRSDSHDHGRQDDRDLRPDSDDDEEEEDDEEDVLLGDDFGDMLVKLLSAANALRIEQLAELVEHAERLGRAAPCRPLGNATGTADKTSAVSS